MSEEEEAAIVKEIFAHLDALRANEAAWRSQPIEPWDRVVAGQPPY